MTETNVIQLRPRRGRPQTTPFPPLRLGPSIVKRGYAYLKPRLEAHEAWLRKRKAATHPERDRVAQEIVVLRGLIDRYLERQRALKLSRQAPEDTRG